MKSLKVLPFGGLNRRFPQHRLASKDVQYAQELRNMISIDGRLRIVEGAERLDATVREGSVKWVKRLYYEVGGDNYKTFFAIMNGYIYRLREDIDTFGQVPINNDYQQSINQDFYPIDAQFKVSEQLTTILVDGISFFKFNGNLSGNWDKLQDKNDIDGNKIFPQHITTYLDRAFVIDRQRNVLIVSANLNPELYDDSTQCAIIALPPGNGGYPVATVVYNGRLYILHEDYIAPLSGNTLATFGVLPGDVNYGYGTRAPRSVCIVQNQLGFLNRRDNEYYLTSGTLGSTERTPLTYDIRLSDMINPIRAELTHATVDSRENILRIAYWPSGGNSLGDEVLYSINEKKWCGRTADRNVSCYSQWNSKGDDGRLVTGRSDTAAVMWNARGFLNFDGSAIHYKFVSASYMGKDEGTDVQFDRFYVDARPLGNSNIPLGYVLDARLGNYGVESMSDQGEVVSLGEISIANQDVFSNLAIPMIDKSKGRMIRFEIEETKLDKEIELYGILAYYNEDSMKYSKYLSGT